MLSLPVTPFFSTCLSRRQSFISCRLTFLLFNFPEGVEGKCVTRLEWECGSRAAGHVLVLPGRRRMRLWLHLHIDPRVSLPIANKPLIKCSCRCQHCQSCKTRKESNAAMMPAVFTRSEIRCALYFGKEACSSLQRSCIVTSDSYLILLCGHTQ